MGDTLTKVKITTAFEGKPDARSLKTYVANGGYTALKKRSRCNRDKSSTRSRRQAFAVAVARGFRLA